MGESNASAGLPRPVNAGKLREFAREQGLAQWKVPREVRVVAELPRSPTGKVLKRVLVEQLQQEA